MRRPCFRKPRREQGAGAYKAQLRENLPLRRRDAKTSGKTSLQRSRRTSATGCALAIHQPTHAMAPNPRCLPWPKSANGATHAIPGQRPGMAHPQPFQALNGRPKPWFMETCQKKRQAAGPSASWPRRNPKPPRLRASAGDLSPAQMHRGGPGALARRQGCRIPVRKVRAPGPNRQPWSASSPRQGNRAPSTSREDFSPRT